MLNIKNYVTFLLSIYLLLGVSCKGSNKVESENNFMAENQELRDRLDDQARANQAANDELRMLRRFYHITLITHLQKPIYHSRRCSIYF